MKGKTLFIALLLIFFNSFSQTKELWGSLSSAPYGAIFKVDTNGSNFQSKFNFEQIGPDNLDFARLCETFNGVFYGISDGGKIFKYTQSTYDIEVVYQIKDTLDGLSPRGTLLFATNGRLYGMTNRGGLYDLGVLFSFNILTNQYTKLVDFNDINGANPEGSLIQGSNGRLYGMTYGGGAGATKRGVLFEYNIATNSMTTLHNFTTATGYRPKGRVLQASNGRLYGTTSDGSCFSRIFEYNLSTSSFRVVGSNCNVGVGIRESALIQRSSNGLIYGVSSSSGPNPGDQGTIFSFAPGGNTVSIVYTFSFGGLNGYGEPVGQLVEINSSLYGYAKGLLGSRRPGIFRYNLLSSSFSRINSNLTRNEGSAGLIRARNGAIIGASSWRGTNVDGKIFEITNTTIGAINRALFGQTNGESPRGSLLQASNGLIYGTTKLGGKHNSGILFSYDPISDVFESVFEFDGLSGSDPIGNLLEASNNKIYGITQEGGIDGRGVLYEYDPSTKIMNKLVDFDSLKGHTPSRGVIQASNGNLYGTTTFGGQFHEGVLFEYDLSTNNYSKKRDFYWFDGAHPIGLPVEVGNGILYGTTSDRGQTNSVGTLYSYNLNTNSFTKLKDFNPNTTGGNPNASLLLASDGHLYGATETGALNGEGAIFKYVISTNTITKEKDFDSNLGTQVEYRFKENSDGSFFLTARNGGVNNRGSLMRYDPQTKVLTKTLDISNISYSSSFPYFASLPFGTLLEVEICKPAVLSKINVSDSLICSGDSVVLSIAASDSLMDATYWALFRDSCGGAALDSNITGVFTVVPTRSASYFIKGRGGCVADNESCESSFIEVIPNYNINDSLTLCLGENYTFPDGSILNNIQNDTTHVSSLSTLIGSCDSTITTTITLNPNIPYNIADTVQICFNSDYTFPDGTIANGIQSNITHISNLQTQSTGCDSTITTTIEVNSLDTTTVIDTVCFGATYILPDSTLSGMLFSDTLIETILQKVSTNCDSTVFTRIFIEGGDTTNLKDTVCYGGSYMLPNNNTLQNLIRDTIVYTLIPSLNNGCDSTIASDLTVLQLDTGLSFNNNTLTSAATGINYQWIDCNSNTLISGANSQTFSPFVNGNYAVLLNQLNCSDTSACYSVILTSVEKNINDTKYIISPNPNTGNVTIKFGEKQVSGRILVKSISGQIVKDESFTRQNSFSFELNEREGVYFIELIESDGNTFRQKILKL